MAIFKKDKSTKILSNKQVSKPKKDVEKKGKKMDYYDFLASKYGVDPVLGKKVKKSKDKPTL